MNVKISVVIPCYNSFEYIDKCLDALQNQTFKDFEVIVVDDKSTDNTYEYLYERKNQLSFPMLLIQNDENSGPNSARQNGVKHACGEYISFCDSDDWYENNYLEEIMNCIQKTDADCVLCNYQYSFADGKIKHINYVEGICIEKKENIIALARDSLCVLTVKKEILFSMKFPALYHGEDAAIIPSILKKCSKIRTVNKGLYNYYIRQNSSSNIFDQKSYYSMLESFEIIEKEIGEDYKIACEYIGIKNIMYSTVYIGIRSHVEKEQIMNLIEQFKKKYPMFEKNDFLSYMPLYKKIFIRCASKHYFSLLNMYIFLHSRFM